MPGAILSAHLKSAIRNYALLFAGCVLFHAVGTWSLPLVDRDEPRFAEASREMIQRGDYIVPYFNDHSRLDKPPLAYWAQAASYRLFGENDFAARFPSAIAAALVALSIFAWGTRVGGNSVGWWAAIIFTLSLQTFLHAKAAVADMWLVLFVTLAHWSGFELIGCSSSESKHETSNPPSRCYGAAGVEHRTSNLWWWMFYVSLAFGFLAKGPIGWAPLATVAATKFFLLDGRLASRFKFARGGLLMLAILALWGIPALVRTHGQFFVVGIGRHVVGRSFASMEGHGANSFGMYLLLLPFYFVTNYTLPAFPLIALLLARRVTTEGSMHFVRNCAFASVSVYLAIALVVPPFVARFFPAYELFQKSRDDLRPDMEFGAVDFSEPSLIWYFRSRVSGYLTPLNSSRMADFMAKAGPRLVIVPTSLTTTLFADHPENWKMFSTRGFNIAKGKRVELTLVLKLERPNLTIH